MEPKQKQHPAVDGTGDGSKVRCCKEQYCIGNRNVRSMNQGKLEMVKQKMARVNVDILGISELKWTRIGEFNSDDHYIHYCGQESFRGNGVAIIVNKSPKCSTWMKSQKRQNDLCSFPRQTIQYHNRKCSRSVVSDSLRPHGLWSTALLRPWDFSGKSTGVGCHFLLQRIFPTQGSNLSLSHCRQTLYHMSHQGSP